MLFCLAVDDIPCTTSSHLTFLLLAETVGASSASSQAQAATFSQERLPAAFSPLHQRPPSVLQRHEAETALLGGLVQLAALTAASASSPRLPTASFATSAHPSEHPRTTAHRCPGSQWVSCPLCTVFK